MRFNIQCTNVNGKELNRNIYIFLNQQQNCIIILICVILRPTLIYYWVVEITE
jgi:hypothetical protein